MERITDLIKNKKINRKRRKRKMKRKFLIVLLALTLAIVSAFALTACGETKTPDDGNGGSTVVTPRTGLLPTIMVAVTIPMGSRRLYTRMIIKSRY